MVRTIKDKGDGGIRLFASLQELRQATFIIIFVVRSIVSGIGPKATRS